MPAIAPVRETRPIREAETPAGPREAREPRAVRRLEAEALRLEDGAARAMLKLLRAARKDLKTRMADLPSDAPHLVTLRDVDQSVRAAMDRLAGQMRATFWEWVRRGFDLGVRYAEAQLPQSDLAFQFGLPDATLQAVSQFHASLVQQVTEELRRKITTAVQVGLLGGKTTDEIALDILGTKVPAPFGPFRTAEQRAMAIARTEMNRVANMGTDLRIRDAGTRISGLRKRWKAAKDYRTRETHKAAHGQEVPVDAPFTVGGHKAMFPGDPALPAGEVVNCFLPGTIVQGTFQTAMRAFYRGEAVEIVTASGNRLSVTPNHPIATPDGFIPAGAVQVGQEFLSYRPELEAVLWSEDVEREPTAAEEVFDAFTLAGLTERRRRTAKDFYGDGERLHGYIEVVRPHGELTGDGEPCGLHKGSDPILKAEDVGHSAEAGKGAAGLHLVGVGGTPAGGLSGGDLSDDSLRIGLQCDPLEALRVGPAANLHPTRYESAAEGVTRDPEFIREALHGSSSFVAVDEVLDVRKFHYQGPVFDFESPYGWIIASGILTSNCRCRSTPVVPPEEDEEPPTPGGSLPEYVPKPAAKPKRTRKRPSP